MENKIINWKNELSSHKKLIIFSLVFLIMALAVNSITGNYVNKKSTVAVPDIILNIIPTLDLDFFFVYGATAIVIVFFLYPLFFNVKKLHIAIIQLSLLIFIRSFFISLTHLSIPADALIFTAPKFFDLLNFKNALFFSGHTAVPFLGYLLFKDKRIGLFFLIATPVMALTVLFMHVHYSIDVFAALFITYGSYKIGNWLLERQKFR